MNLYYNIISFLEKIKRSYAYAKLGFNNYDFDALSIETYLLFKLKRVEYCLINGSCDLTVENGPKKMKALKLCIKLLERLNGNYNRFMTMHDKKWGELHTWFEPSVNGLTYWKCSRPNANTPEFTEKERKEFLEAANADYRQEIRDRKIVYKLINKYIRDWWD
jgi:hypothetical protein